MDNKIYKYEDLEKSDLIVDAVYEGGSLGNYGDDPIHKILPVGNSGGIRKSVRSKTVNYVVLFSTNNENEWPDFFDSSTGILRFYGDNRTPGKDIKDTVKKGNILLENIFHMAEEEKTRKKNPLVFVFEKYPTENSKRSVKFLGVFVPGSYTSNISESLIAIWRRSGKNRFQNYEAFFSCLNIREIKRSEIEELSLKGISKFKNPVWIKYITHGLSSNLVLKSQNNEYHIESKNEQLPRSNSELKVLQYIYEYYSKDSYKFESFAAKIVEMMDKNFIEIELTRPFRDGGRDAIGKYIIRSGEIHQHKLKFSMEAKCYNLHNSVGVKEISRLISRIKNKEFGVLVTTSYINKQVLKEVFDDQHPILYVTGIDIIHILNKYNIRNINDIKHFIIKEKLNF